MAPLEASGSIEPELSATARVEIDVVHRYRRAYHQIEDHTSDIVVSIYSGKPAIENLCG